MPGCHHQNICFTGEVVQQAMPCNEWYDPGRQTAALLGANSLPKVKATQRFGISTIISFHSTPTQSLRAAMDKWKNTSLIMYLVPVKNRRREWKRGKQRRMGIQLWSYLLCHWKQSYSQKHHLVCLSQNWDSKMCDINCFSYETGERVLIQTASLAQTSVHFNLQHFPEQSLTLFLFLFLKEVSNFFHLLACEFS